MEFAIGVAIAVIITGFIKIGRSKSPRQTRTVTGHEREKREADEVITVILPTINNDK